MRFVNVHSHCIVSNLENDKQNFDVSPHGKFLRTSMPPPGKMC